MHSDGFSRYHPLVNFTYFTIVIVFNMFFMHPITLIISLISSFAYTIELEGKKAIISNLKFMIPTILITALINPAFNHEGATILTYLPSGNPLTLESITYGFAAAVMFVSVISWFNCYNKVMTSDKFIYLFGRIIPSLSLVLSMVLRFVPMFQEKIKEISFSQKSIGRDISKGSIIDRAKNGLKILSIMITWMLDNALDTGDSMRSRGYGLEGRTAFSIYTFEDRDKKALFFLLIIALFIGVAHKKKILYFRFFPTMKGEFSSWYSLSVFIAYFLLCTLPLYLNRKDRKQWKLSQLEI